MKEASLYIHIPFCEHKCIYCDFYSIITSERIEEYLEHVKREISFRANSLAAEREINTIFFGGGTPSLLEPQQIDDLLLHFHKSFTVSKQAEFTLETNPGTVDKGKLSEFRSAGINRLSVGIQTFDDEELNFLTRIHNKQTAIDTVVAAHEAGFSNINIDLIFNLPKQTKEKWLSNLETAVSLPITHLSAYSLILERGTILNKLVLDKKVVLQDDDYDAELYEKTIEFLTSHNFKQYEVSNFALSGYECKHNLAYWRHNEYVGFGTSAHSFLKNKRWWNYSPLHLYINSVAQYGHALVGEETLDDTQLLEEYVMLALRSSGLSVVELISKFGKEWFEKRKALFDEYLRNEFMKRTAHTISLTKKGYAVCDELIASLIA